MTLSLVKNEPAEVVLEQKHILDFVDPNITLRVIQSEFLTWLEANIDKYDVILGKLPVAAGKSICATVTAKYISEVLQSSTALITPLKILQDQYTNEFHWLPVLKGMDEYSCVCNPGHTCGDHKRGMGQCCKYEEIVDMGKTGHCPYLYAREAAQCADKCIFNFHSYSFNKMFKDVLIIDEGHNAEKFLYGLFGNILWKCECKYPDDLGEDSDSVAVWLKEYIQVLTNDYEMLMVNNNLKEMEKLEEKINSYQLLWSVMLSDPKNMIIKKKKDIYRGHHCEECKKLKNTEQEYLFIKPLKINKIGTKLLWPEKVNKIIFFSATLSDYDMEILGLSGRRIGIFEGPSPIPKENRRVIYFPLASMSFKNRKNGYMSIAKGILSLANKRPGESGLVHCTYETAQVLRSILPKGDERFLFHTQSNKIEIYNIFKKSKGKILIASGMSEGIDLPYDQCRWQVITQIMWPYRGDEVNEWRLNNNTSLYNWDTLRQLLQQLGRVCRTPTDKGDTYIFDSQFGYLFTITHTQLVQSGKPSMWPTWALESIVWDK